MEASRGLGPAGVRRSAGAVAIREGLGACRPSLNPSGPAPALTIAIPRSFRVLVFLHGVLRVFVLVVLRGHLACTQGGVYCDTARLLRGHVHAAQPWPWGRGGQHRPPTRAVSVPCPACCPCARGIAPRTEATPHGSAPHRMAPHPGSTCPHLPPPREKPGAQAQGGAGGRQCLQHNWGGVLEQGVGAQGLGVIMVATPAKPRLSEPR